MATETVLATPEEIEAQRRLRCKRGDHDWRATMGGPYGYCEADREGYLQVCAACEIKRPPTHMEQLLMDVVAALREDLDALRARVRA
jgi:hypothetical protein